MVLDLSNNWNLVDKSILKDNRVWSGTVSIKVEGKELKRANIWKRDIPGIIKISKLYSEWFETEYRKNFIPVNLEITNNNYVLNLKNK